MLLAIRYWRSLWYKPWCQQLSWLWNYLWNLMKQIYGDFQAQKQGHWVLWPNGIRCIMPNCRFNLDKVWNYGSTKWTIWHLGASKDVNIVDIVILVYGFSAFGRSSPVTLDVFSPAHHFHHMMPQLEWWHFHRRRPSSPAPSWRAKGWWHVMTVFLGAAYANWKTAVSFPRFLDVLELILKEWYLTIVSFWIAQNVAALPARVGSFIIWITSLRRFPLAHLRRCQEQRWAKPHWAVDGQAVIICDEKNATSMSVMSCAETKTHPSRSC